MKNSREQFEEWFPQMVDGMPENMVKVFDEMLFTAWQASRAAIVVSLPDKEDPANFFCEIYDCYKVQEALSAHGIKIEGEI